MVATPALTLRAVTAVVQLVLLFLVLTWIVGYLQGFSISPTKLPDGANDTGRLFNWHPLLMVLAFPLLMAEAVLAYRSPYLHSFSRQQQKTAHASLHMSAIVLAALGVLAAWKSHTLKRPVPTPNLYSAHSWLGILTFSLAVAQAIAGVLIYVYPKLSLTRRAAAYKVHFYFGTATFTVALATMCVGIQEKATFTQVFGKAYVYAPIMRLPAAIVLFIVLTGMLVLAHHTFELDQEQPASDAVQYERVV